MYAYAPNGTLITGTKDSLFATAELGEGTFSRAADGSIVAEGGGGSKMDWDSQRTVVQRGQPMWMDDEGEEWPECALILVENELDYIDDEDDPAHGEMATLPADEVERATRAYDAWLARDPKAAPVDRSARYAIEMPETGWRSRDSFTPDEKARLRPVAEVLALLDGNAFFGMDTDADGDDRHYERYLPEAAAIADANNGWFDLASFAREGRPLPVNPMGLELDERPDGRVDLAAGDLVTVRITGIVWDTSGEGAEDAVVVEGADLSPLLPPDLVVGVPADWSEHDRLVTLLGDHYGFRVASLGSAERVED